jgi:mycothiol system anti-sigma-R factor
VITCRNCLQALHPYIDRELSDEDIVHVREHLDACPGCFHLYEFEESVRRLVRVKCLQQLAPESLRLKISACFENERQRLQRKQGR